MINKPTQFLLSLYHYSIFIRDTLEYTFRKDVYHAQAYKARRNALVASLTEKGQIKMILSKLGENGPKIEDKLKEFIQLVYSDDSTVVKETPTELRVDHAQHLAIFEMVVGLHQTIWDMVLGYLQAAETRNDVTLPLRPLFAADERMYRSIVFFAIMTEIEKVFAEFQKAMRESKGQKTPQSNYIINDLTKLVQLINFQKAHSHIKDTAFNDMIDHNLKVLEMIEGKRELPLMTEDEVDPDTKRVGVMIDGVRHHSFQDVFAAVREATRAVLADSERTWKELYKPISQEMMDIVKTTPEGEPGPHPFDA